MPFHRRITLALVGLIALVLVAWLVRDLSGGGSVPQPAPRSSEQLVGSVFVLVDSRR